MKKLVQDDQMRYTYLGGHQESVYHFLTATQGSLSSVGIHDGGDTFGSSAAVQEKQIYSLQ